MHLPTSYQISMRHRRPQIEFSFVIFEDPEGGTEESAEPVYKKDVPNSKERLCIHISSAARSTPSSTRWMRMQLRKQFLYIVGETKSG